MAGTSDLFRGIVSASRLLEDHYLNVLYVKDVEPNRPHCIYKGRSMYVTFEHKWRRPDFALKFLSTFGGQKSFFLFRMKCYIYELLY